jgi:hypothetical protein
MLLETNQSRANLLEQYGATSGEIEELLAYNANSFSGTLTHSSLPLESEPHITDWKGYAVEAESIGTFSALKQHLVQLQFPIRSGISQTDDYRAATRKGQTTVEMATATGLVLQEPEALKLLIHPTVAGAIPVIITGCRADFVALVQALTRRNEPDSIPDSMGSVIVGGYNNWSRVRQYRQAWESRQPQPVSEPDWQVEFQNLIPQKSRYQDRFILLSRGVYSAVSAVELGLPEAEWLESSLMVRLEHECCHYFTRRVFGVMRNNALDELIADYQGIISVNYGQYRADWFLRFVGLEAFPHYRQGGRLQNYRGEPPLSDRAFTILQCLVKDAAENLERFNHRHLDELQTSASRSRLLVILTTLTLEDLCREQGNVLEQLWLNGVA